MHFEDSDNDDDVNEILPTDNVLIAGKIDKDFSGLEIYIYDD